MRVVIAGGGLVGLTLAALLRRRGLEPQVVERMPAGVYVRRGFMLGHQAYDAMAELGVLEGIRAAGRAIGATPDGGSAATAIEVGRVLAVVGEPRKRLLDLRTEGAALVDDLSLASEAPPAHRRRAYPASAASISASVASS
jgi:2-polyprenyl-6-methoxyphenol hydroxylase-like FAD-dependent oxidoreductase